MLSPSSLFSGEQQSNVIALPSTSITFAFEARGWDVACDQISLEVSKLDAVK